MSLAAHNIRGGKISLCVPLDPGPCTLLLLRVLLLSHGWTHGRLDPCHEAGPLYRKHRGKHIRQRTHSIRLAFVTRLDPCVENTEGKTFYREHILYVLLLSLSPHSSTSHLLITRSNLRSKLDPSQRAIVALNAQTLEPSTLTNLGPGTIVALITADTIGNTFYREHILVALITAHGREPMRNGPRAPALCTSSRVTGYIDICVCLCVFA